MSEAKHTPYTVHAGSLLTEGLYVPIWDSTGGKVGTVLKDSAPFIVRACNSHEALCEAVAMAFAWSDDGSPDSERGPLEQEFRAKARAVFMELGEVLPS